MPSRAFYHIAVACFTWHMLACATATAQTEVTLRSASLYPDASWINVNTNLAEAYLSFDTTNYVYPGLEVTLAEPTRLTRIIGVGATFGTPAGRPMIINLFDPPGANFGLQAPFGDALDFANQPVAGIVTSVAVNSYGPGIGVLPTFFAEVDLVAQDIRVVLPAGDYILSITQSGSGTPWHWLESPVDLSPPDWATLDEISPAAVLIEDQPGATTGTVAVDLFGVPCDHTADFDTDCDVDVDDFAEFEACMSGPTIPVAAGCEAKDFDNDGDTDMADFGMFQRCYSGDGNLPDPDCVN